MRIALLHAFAAEAGGAEVHVQRLRQLLTHYRHEVSVVDLLDKDAPLASLARFQPDVVHLHNLPRRPARVHGCLRALGRPVVRTLHDHSMICPAGSLFAKGAPCQRCTAGAFHRAGLNGCIDLLESVRLSASALLGRWPATRGIARFLSPSPDLAARLRRAGLDARIDVIGTFVPDDQIAAERASIRERTVLCSGRLVAGKGLDVLLSAARGLDARVVIAGSGPLHAPLRERIRSEGLTHVELAGHLTGDEYFRRLRGASLLVVPAEASEVTPNVICEAFASGVPVVGTAVDGVRPLVGHTRGIVVPPGDAPALRRAIRELLDDDDRRGTMGHAALAFAREDLSADRYGARLSAVYADVIAAHA